MLAALGCCAAAGAGLAGCSSHPHSATPRTAGTTAPAPKQPAASPAVPRRPFAVGLRVVRLVDRTRHIRLPDGTTVPRTLVTYVRYPAVGAPSRRDVRDARAAVAGGPYPLVIFGHGFTLAPQTYAPLLHAIAASGYVVAAPAFPLEKADAPGGPDESDLVNQPADMSFTISRLVAAGAAARGPLRGLIQARRIAVAGHSDGGETAAAVAYDRAYRDRRVKAVVLLAGARIPGPESLVFGRGSPPLLAMQGTADPINPPASTYDFFAAASRPKYLLKLQGAAHEPPYTVEQPQLRVVERAFVAFLDRYLRRRPGAARRLASAGRVAGVSALTAAP